MNIPRIHDSIEETGHETVKFFAIMFMGVFCAILAVTTLIAFGISTTYWIVWPNYYGIKPTVGASFASLFATFILCGAALFCFSKYKANR